jgi:hypothetical protein
MSKPFDRSTMGGRIASATAWTLGVLLYVGGLVALCLIFPASLGWIIPTYLFGSLGLLIIVLLIYDVFLPWVYTGNWDGRAKMEAMMSAYGITDPRQYSAADRAHTEAAFKGITELEERAHPDCRKGEVRFP